MTDEEANSLDDKGLMKVHDEGAQAFEVHAASKFLELTEVNDEEGKYLDDEESKEVSI